MARSMTVVVGTNEYLKEMVSNIHIPYDLAFSILSKLPIKSLKRFGCVRKSWSLLFENPYFMNMLRNHFLSNSNRRRRSDDYGGDTFLLIHEGEPSVTYLSRFQTIYLLSNGKFDNRIKLDLPPPFHEDDSLVYILSSVSINGILCVGQDTRRGGVKIFQAVLWNPATAEYMVIPPSPDESIPPYRDPWSKFDGFGYDHVRDDYKLIRYISFFELTDEDEDVSWEDRSYEPLLEIYSLRSNSWKILEIDMHDINNYIFDSPRDGTGVYADGVCHWWANYYYLDNNLTGCLVSFDFGKEVLFTTPPPMLLDTGEYCDSILERRLVVLNESIALISNWFQATTFHISILSELGVKESWLKLFIVSISSIECPIGVGKKGNICFKQKNDELVWIDLSTQIIDEIGVKGVKYSFQMGIYNESLLQIGGFNN